MSNLKICNVKMSNKKIWQHTISYSHFLKKNSDAQYISERPEAELRTNFWTRLYQNSMWRVRNIFWASLYKKNYVVFFSVFVLGKSLHNTTECKEFAPTDTHVSTATYVFTVTRTWNMAAKLGKGWGTLVRWKTNSVGTRQNGN